MGLWPWGAQLRAFNVKKKKKNLLTFKWHQTLIVGRAKIELKLWNEPQKLTQDTDTVLMWEQSSLLILDQPSRKVRRASGGEGEVA